MVYPEPWRHTSRTMAARIVNHGASQSMVPHIAPATLRHRAILFQSGAVYTLQRRDDLTPIWSIGNSI